MSTQITLTLADETYQRAEHLAQLTGKDVAEILADTLSISLQQFSVQGVARMPVAELSDAEIVTIADSQMEAKQDERLSILLDKQQAGKLESAEHSELVALMQMYQEGLLRKSQALNEAVKRGLRKPLEP